MEKNTMIHLRISKDLKNEIEKAAKKVGELNTSSFIRLAIVKYINEIKKTNQKG